MRGGWIACACLWAGFAAAETEIGFQLHGESAATRDDGLFSFPSEQRPFPIYGGVGELYLRQQQAGMVLEWAGDWRAEEGTDPSAQGRLNELYADFSAHDLDFTVGKKVMSSGIGFGFRPLDVIQREDRRTLTTTRLEGVPLLAAEQIDADSALSLIYFNRLDADEHDVTRGDHEAVVRYYQLRGDTELHALLYLHERLGPAPGVGFTWVHGESLELHGVALYQPRLERRVHNDTLLATSDPWEVETGREDGRALLGFTWTGEAGYSLLLEAWHDGEAMSKEAWDDLRATAAAQRALLGSAPDAAVYGNLAWDLRAYERPSLLRNNLLLRLSYDGDRSDPYLDLLLTPEDGGYVATAGLEYEWRRGLRVAAGARGFGGPEDSAYGQMPVRGLVYLELRGNMVR